MFPLLCPQTWKLRAESGVKDAGATSPEPNCSIAPSEGPLKQFHLRLKGFRAVDGSGGALYFWL